MRKTNTVEFPHGKVFQALLQIKTKCQPSDLTAEVDLEEELENVKFHSASDYYKSFVNIQSKYDVIISEMDQVKMLSKKCNSQTFSKMIMDHLNDTTIPNSLETIFSDIGKIQRLAKTGSGGGQKGGEKEVHLAQADGYFPGTCSHCGKKGHKRKDCPDRKAGKPKAGSGGGGGGGNNNNKTCNFCGGKGHTEDGCWKKKPELAPEWLKKNLKAQAEASGSSVEIMMCCIECDEDEEQDFAEACV